jgi:hypothetical protein
VDLFGQPDPPGPLPYADIFNPQSLNKYSYTYNNPLRYIDPNGHDALWFENKDTGPTLVIPVHFTGIGATPEAIYAITTGANQLDTGGSGVKIQVVATDKPINGVLNTLEISPGSDGKYGTYGDGTNKLGGNKGSVNTDTADSNGAAKHEIMHFAGINDQYDEKPTDAKGNRSATIRPGYDGSNIMVDRNGKKLKPQQLQEANRNRTTRHCTTDDKGQTKCH